MLRAQEGSIRYLQAALVAALVIPSVLFTYAGWTSWNNIHELSDREIDRSRAVINEHAVKVFEAVQRTVSEINEIIRDSTDPDISGREQELHERLRRMAEESAEIKSLWIFGRDGRALVNSLSFPAGDTKFSDRDYFNAHVEKDIGTYVGSVLRPRAPFGGAPFFGVSRRRTSKDGNFVGVIQASVLPEYFETFYQRLARDPGEYASLIRGDGLILARYPALGREAKLVQDGPLYQSMLKQPASGQVTLISAIDGAGRTVAYRKLDNFPVFVLAGLETVAIRNRWLSQMGSHLIFGIPATAALVSILALALRRTRRLYAEATARHAAEEALKQSQRLEALGQLTGGVAHDFNNLLMIVAGSADRARRHSKDPDVERSLSMISMAVQKGQTLTRRLLSFSRRQTLKPKAVDLTAAISEFEEVLRQSIRADIDLRFLAPSERVVVMADVDELEISLLNLVLNARDAINAGGAITISVVSGAASSPNEKFAAICVLDTGVGIPEDVRGRIFEPYFTTKADKGNGLGLSQVYGFAQQSGGTVTVESEIGKGSKFCLWLPKTDLALSAPEKPRAIGVESLAGKKILLVEDNADVGAVAADYIQQCGCSVVRAESAEAAMSLIRGATDVDVVVSDVVMPGIGGLALGRWVRRHHLGLPVILATGYSDQAAVATKEGFSLLSKPYSFETLRNALAEQISVGADRSH